jgi:phage terminase large subunit-like protein
MADPLPIEMKRDRRGGWNARSTLRHDGPIAPAAPAREPIAFINSLTHTKGAFAGQTFRLRPWQIRILKRIFKKRPDGLRQYRTVLLMLPRKNGKT